MPKNKLSEYSSTAGDNTDIGGINIAEGMAPSDVNNAMREQMSQLKEFIDGSSGDTITTSKIVATTATILSGANVTGTATFNSAVVLSSSVTGTTASFSGEVSGILTNATGLPIATGVSGLGTNVASFLATPSSSNLAAAVTDETGSGSLVFATSPTLVTPVLGTPTSGNLSNCTVDGTNEVGFRNVPAVGTKTTSYTLAVGDVGKYVQIGTGGSITIPDATFSEGDAVSLFNNTTGDITVTCTITTAFIAGTDEDKATVTLATRGVATILFISGTVCVITGNIS